VTEETTEFKKEYLNEKLQAIGDKLGDAYGEPFMAELIVRMERTVAHFNEEVNGLLKTLHSRTRNQYGLLASMRGEDPNAEPVELSEFEKKLSTGDGPKKDVPEKEVTEEKPKRNFHFLSVKRKNENDPRGEVDRPINYMLLSCLGSHFPRIKSKIHGI